MGLSRKYSISEENGTEFPYSKEAIPNAEDVAVVTTSANTLVGADLQDILNKLNRPSVSQKPTYLGNGDLDYITFYKNSTQTTENRIAAVLLTYTSGLPTSETWTLYSDTDGTTVLKTITLTNTFTSGDLTNTTMSTT